MKIDGAPYALKFNGLADSHVRHVHIANGTFKDMDSASNSIKNADDVRFTDTTINGRPRAAEPAGRRCRAGQTLPRERELGRAGPSAQPVRSETLETARS